MDYTKLFSEASDTDVHLLFTFPLDQPKFKLALAAATELQWRGSAPSATASRIFRYGIRLLAEAVEFPTENRKPQNDLTVTVPLEEEDITLQMGVKGAGPAQKNEPIQTESHDITTLMGARKASGVDPLEVGSAENSLHGSIENGKASESGPGFRESDGIRRESHSSFRKSSIVRESLSRHGSRQDSRQDLGHDEITLGKLDTGSRNVVLGQIATVFRLWFENLWAASEEHKIDAVGIVFGLPGTSSALTEHDLYELLVRIKWFMDVVLDLPKSDCEFVGSFKQHLVLLHDVLRGLYRAVSLEREHQGSNLFLIVKSLLHAFFKADFSQTLDRLLAHTEGLATEDLRLSYETLMRVYTVVGSLSSSPINILLVDKVSLSLDITTLNHVSPNVYANFLRHKEFDAAAIRQLESRVFPLLAAAFNYYYELQPDLLAQALNHTSFFSWVTGHRFAPGLYLGTETFVSSMGILSPVDSDLNPFLNEVALYETTARQNAIAILGTNDERTLRAPAYLNVTLLLYLSIQNPSFLKYLLQPPTTPDGVSLLELWLCVTSYVLHYQYKSPINLYAARLGLLIMLKLTSTKSDSVHTLRERNIDEFRWKLCHHRGPVVPTDLRDGEKSVLTYMVDIVQIMLRFNLTKRLDLTNCKIALTVLYQILLEYEAHPFDGLRYYQWNELYKTLIHFVKFISKNCNEEAVKFVVEEVFLVFELVLSPAFDSVVEPDNFWSMGKHLAKSINYDLLLNILQHHQALLELFEKYIIKKDNFARVNFCLGKLSEVFDLLQHRERDASEVTAKLNDFSIKEELTVVLEKFNYAETFKFFDKDHDYIDFDKQVEIIDLFNLLYDTTWVYRRKK